VIDTKRLTFRHRDSGLAGLAVLLSISGLPGAFDQSGVSAMGAMAGGDSLLWPFARRS
jgi:hypothetical protein